MKLITNLSVLCQVDCVDAGGLPERCLSVPVGASPGDGMEEEEEELESLRSRDKPREGLVTYSAGPRLPLSEPALKTGEVWHLSEDGQFFHEVTLSLHANGFSIKTMGNNPSSSKLPVAWSPFSLVQACRLHSTQADEKMPWMRLFKVSVFHHGLTYFFATQGNKADIERACWVADVSRALRMLTQSLFPPFSIRVDPLPGATWTESRLLAGYLLLYDELGVSLVYGELHTHWDASAIFAAYEDDLCDVEVLHLSIDMNTLVSERVGVDCSCFSLGDHHFSTRTCAEKMLWLRAISNVKVKLRHSAMNPTRTDLKYYRAAVLEQARSLPRLNDAEISSRGALLPRRCNMSMLQLASNVSAGDMSDDGYPTNGNSGITGGTAANGDSAGNKLVIPLGETATNGSAQTNVVSNSSITTRLHQTRPPQRLALLSEPEAEGVQPPPIPVVATAAVIA